MIKPIITIKERESYGVARLYPTNKLGKDFAQLLNKKTLNVDELKFLHTLGVEVTMDKEWTSVSLPFAS
jgi:hypothetical protein|tara:strand:+ start:1321 stop:1527 length:207 start_codon:yes stop_codon:yes gene_type:complete